MDIKLIGNLINTVGAFFLVASYLPQITMLLKTKKSDGMSVSFWVILIIGMTGLLINMIISGASLMVWLTQVINILLAAIVLALVLKYRKGC